MYLAYSLTIKGSDDTIEHKPLTDSAEFTQNLGIIMLVCIAVTILGKFISSMIFMSINRNMHTKIVESLIHTHMSFFDENTTGRIMNRMSKDVQVMDDFVFSFLDMIDYQVKCTMSVIFIAIS